MSNSSIVLVRAAAFAAVLGVPTALAFAADSAPTQQTTAPAPRQQAQAFGATVAPAAATNGSDVNGDDPYVTASRQEKFRTGQQAPARFSNEPNWNGPEYTGQ